MGRGWAVNYKVNGIQGLSEELTFKLKSEKWRVTHEIGQGHMFKAGRTGSAKDGSCEGPGLFLGLAESWCVKSTDQK